MSQLVLVQFHTDTLEAIRDERGVWVNIRRVCESLGLDPDSQRRRLINPDKCPWATCVQLALVAEDGKQREVTVLHLDCLPMWLATVEVGRVAEHMRPKLILYQKECARVLRDHFFPPAPTLPVETDPILATNAMIMAATAQIMAALEQVTLLRRSQLEQERAIAEANRLTHAAHTEALAAHNTARAALDQAEGNFGYYTVLAWHRLHGRDLTVGEAARHGRQLTALCHTNNVPIRHMNDPRFGTVNLYPEGVLDEFFAPVEA